MTTDEAASAEQVSPAANGSVQSGGLLDELSGSLLRAIPALIAITTPEGEIDEISESYHDYTGLTAEEARDWRSHQVIHPDDFEQAMAVWGQALRAGEPMQNEMRLRRHDGIYRWHLVQGTPVRDARGGVRCWLTVSVDIEDRKRAELHARYLAEATARLVAPLDSEQLLAEIARLAVPSIADICAIGVFDGSARTVRVETAGADERERPLVARVHLRGWRVAAGSDESFGDRIAAGGDVYVPDFSPEFVCGAAPNDDERDAALELGGGSLVCLPLATSRRAIGMVTFATTRSRRRYTHEDVAVLREVAARLSIAMENIELYRELQSVAHRLEHANAAKDAFLGMVSHELKTPITTALGNAKVLRRTIDSIDRETRDEALADIVESAERLNRIIEDLLALARLEQGDKLDVEPLILREIIANVIEEQRRRDPRRVFQLETSGSRAPILGAPTYIEHVARNLVSNAAKYSPSSEPIDVHVIRHEREVHVLVLDRGPGVPDEEREQIFEPFQRGQGATRAPGLGLGLSVCRRVIEAQQGRIWCAPREGGGSEFGFALPLVLE